MNIGIAATYCELELEDVKLSAVDLDERSCGGSNTVLLVLAYFWLGYQQEHGQLQHCRQIGRNILLCVGGGMGFR